MKQIFHSAESQRSYLFLGHLRLSVGFTEFTTALASVGHLKNSA